MGEFAKIAPCLKYQHVSSMLRAKALSAVISKIVQATKNLKPAFW